MTAEVQDRLFRQHLRYCADRSPFYRQLLRDRGISIEDIGVGQIEGLPLTSKEDLEAHNDQFLAAPMSRVVDIVQSSGTTGRPTRIMYTAADLDRLAHNERTSFAAAGLTSDDVVLLTCTMDRCFIAGLAYFLGLRALGAATIRNGHGTLESHCDILARMRPTALIGVPSFLRKLGLHAAGSGAAAGTGSVWRIVCIGELLRDRDLQPLPVERDLRRLWSAQTFSTYASSEIATTFCECEAGQGGHLHADLAVLEILDDLGCPVADGDVGEVVVTPLGVEGMPLLRFRTGDLSFIVRGPCPCGRPTPRLGPILGRRRQMIKLKGTTLYPEAIGLALDDLGQVEEYYVEVRTIDRLSDAVLVHLCSSDPGLTAARVEEFLGARLRVKPQVAIEPAAEVVGRVFSPEQRKPMRFFDRRTP